MKKKIIALSLALVMCLAFVACGDGGNSDTQSTSDNNNKYLTKVQWALDTPYICAVEVDGYDGDILTAGTYTATTMTNKLGECQIYDLYIESELFPSISELGEIDYSVGGAGFESADIELHSGDYLYIVPVDMVYKASDALTLTLK